MDGAETATGLAAWCAWLGDTAWSTALRESLWAYPIVDTVHVLGLIGFVGAAILLDLRLIGLALTGVPAAAVVERTRHVLFGGFAVMASTGLLLFGANPVKFAGNPFFQLKLVLLAVAGINALLFQAGVYRRIAIWNTSAATPPQARIAGWVSLAAWTAIIIAGRLIAFYETGSGV